jgi:hypothetical protein
MSLILLEDAGGNLVLPDKLLCDRHSGGHLIVNPPRPVWERSMLTPTELVSWSLLVAAAGRAMLDTLPVLREGCLNYWEAGNWALNELAEPFGRKNVQAHRRVHLHLLGRSRLARDPDWRWGESPRFADFVDSDHKSSLYAPLTEAERQAIAVQTRHLLDTQFRLNGPAGQPT